MKNFALTFVLLAFSICLSNILKAHAATISGKIEDTSGEAVPFANIILLNLPDSSINTGVTSGMEGEFQLPVKEEGSYLLKVTMMGFEGYYREITPKEATNGLDMGTLVLNEKSEVLKAVEVNARRPQYISHPDKLVMDVENTSLHDGSTAFDVLSKAPGVWVDQNGQLSLNGKKGVRILLNGRAVYLTGEELRSMLEGMSSESIKNIEVIDNPSAKYDAEGAGGVININLKTDSKSGLNGAFFTNYNYNGFHAGQAGLNLNGRKNRFSGFLNANYGNSIFMREMDTRRTLKATNFEITQMVEDRRSSLKPNLDAGVDYQISKRDRIGMNYRGSGVAFNGDWNTKNNILEDGVELQADAFNKTKRTRSNHMYNVHYSHDFNHLDSKFNINVHYADLNSTSSSSFNNYFTQNQNQWQEELSAGNTSYFDIYSIQGDYEMNIPGIDAKLESGSKYSLVKSENTLAFYTHEGHEKAYDSVRSNNFNYTEQIKAGYVSVNKKVSDKTTIKGGLRAEHTQVNGRSLQAGEDVNRNFISFFPSLFVQHKLSEKYEVNFSYSRRITRANYKWLNPGIMYTDPYSYIQGNPLLRSQYTHGFSFTQVFAQQVNLSLGYDIAKDFIGEMPLQDPETNQTVFSIRNYDRMQNINLRLLAPVQVTNKWQSNSQLIVAHQQFNTMVEGQAQLNVQNMFSFRSTQSITLPKDIVLDLLTAYQGPVAHGVYRISSYWYVDLAVKKSFMDKKLDLSLNFTDVFRTFNFQASSDINGNTIEVGQYQYQQGVRLNLRYNFSLGDKFKSTGNKAELDEIKRAG